MSRIESQAKKRYFFSSRQECKTTTTTFHSFFSFSLFLFFEINDRWDLLLLSKSITVCSCSSIISLDQIHTVRELTAHPYTICCTKNKDFHLNLHSDHYYFFILLLSFGCKAFVGPYFDNFLYDNTSWFENGSNNVSWDSKNFLDTI